MLGSLDLECSYIVMVWDQDTVTKIVSSYIMQYYWCLLLFTVRTTMSEATAFGVAMAAGIASGAWQLDNISPPASDRSFDPVMAVEGWHGILSSHPVYT